MSISEMVNQIEGGKIVYLEKEQKTATLPWNAHPTFKGVSLKHLIKGESTNSKFSCHLVKVESGCEIGEHIHEGKWELHEIIGGIGKGILKDAEIHYAPGISVVIPEGIKHKVIAGEEGLYILATFVPALA